MPFDAVIFDMDGLLIDSERIALQAFEYACRRIGVVIGRSVYLRCIGTSAERTREILMEAVGDRFPYRLFDMAWAEAYERLVDAGAVTVREGAQPLVHRLRASAIPLAVATSTARHRALIHLSRTDLLPHFDVLVCGDEVSQAKPDPEIYLETAARLNVPPTRCLAIEDSDNGVRAAHAAGMAVIQVPDLVPPSTEVRALGHLVLGSLAQVADHLDALRADRGVRPD